MIKHEEINNVDTPVIWVDLDIMENNIRLMAARMREAGVDWRPHTKGIKIPDIAKKLIEAGAIGITCAKLTEAEIMGNAGIKDILIGNQVVGTNKVNRLIALQNIADVMVAVDDFDNAKMISEKAVEADRKIRVLVELNIGMQRAGIEPGENALHFVKRVCALPGIEFCGLMGWEGHIVGIADPAEKDTAGRKAMAALTGTVDLVKDAGIDVPIVSCGGTGSYKISAYTLGVTEIQAGGAIFGDQTYVRWGAETTPSLFVIATVTSHNVPERAVVDTGQKSLTNVTMPKPVGLEGVEVKSLSSEHGVLAIENPDIKLKVGDKIMLSVGYGDWTLFLHDQLFGVRNGFIENIYEIPHQVV